MKFLCWQNPLFSSSTSKLKRLQWRRWLRIAQVIVTITLIGLLLRVVQWSSVPSMIINLHWGFFIVSILLVLCSHLLNVLRWKYLLQRPSPEYSTLLVFYGAGLFSNNFLPTGIGGDGIRVALLSRYVSLPRAIFSVGMDRTTGLLALGVFIVPGVWFGLPPGLWNDTLAAISGISNVVLSGLTFLLGIGLLGMVFWHRLPRLQTIVMDTLVRFTGISNKEQLKSRIWLWLVAGAYGFSIVSNFGLIVANWTVMQALGIEVSPGAAIWIVLAGSFALLLPIAVNGLGVMESVYVVLLTGYGVSTTTAIGVALLIRILMLFFSLLGGLVSLCLGSAFTPAEATPQSDL